MKVGFGTQKKDSIPNHYVTLLQLINDDIGDHSLIFDADGNSLSESIKMFQKSLKELTRKLKGLEYKNNGPIDKPSSKKKKLLRSIKRLYINLREQRIEAIEVDNIVNNLVKDGGFSYKSALTLSIIDNKKYKIKVTVDGMHRIIMAYLCGVDQVAITEEEEVSPDATEKEIEALEHHLFLTANERSAKVDAVTQKCNNKKSGNMSAKEKKQDAAFSDPRVRISVGKGTGAYGVHRSKTSFVYEAGFDEWYRLLDVTSCKYYIGMDAFADIRDDLVTVIFKDRSIDVALAYLLKISNGKQKRSLLNYVKSDSFDKRMIEKGYNYWTGGVEHGKNVETTVIRIATHWNEWYRDLDDGNIIDLTTIPFINDMNMETKCFTVDSIFHEKPISKTQTIIDEFVENNDGTNVTNNSIEDDFDDINDSLNTEFETSDDEEKVEAV
tara:strand:+ start:148 stop:1464 length:1317 start_codon:yes stop_codon:yes gene_type:complete